MEGSAAGAENGGPRSQPNHGSSRPGVPAGEGPPPQAVADGGGAGRTADTLLSSDIETCIEVLETLLADDKSRVAWLMGFLVGSSVAGHRAPD